MDDRKNQPPALKKPNPLRVWDALEAVAHIEAAKGGQASRAWIELVNAIREQLGDEPLEEGKPATGSQLAIAPAALPPTRGDIVGIARPQQRAVVAAPPVPKTGSGRQSFETPNTGERRKPNTK